MILSNHKNTIKLPNNVMEIKECKGMKLVLSKEPDNTVQEGAGHHGAEVPHQGLRVQPSLDFGQRIFDCRLWCEIFNRGCSPMQVEQNHWFGRFPSALKGFSLKIVQNT